MMQGWFSIRSAAGYCDTSVRTLRGWLRSGLKHSRIKGGKVLVKATDLDDFLSAYEVRGDEVSRIVGKIEKEMNL